MTKSRLSLSTVIVLGAIGPGAWSAPTPVAGDPVGPASAPQSPADLRARMITLRVQQQATPEDPDPAYQLGALYLDLGNPSAAEEQLRRALDLGSPQADLWPLLAQAWLAREKYAEIQTEIPTDRLAPTQQAAVTVVQGLAWLAKDRPEEARRSLEEALSLEPEYAPAYLGLARVAIAQGDLPAARQLLERAASGRAPDRAEVATLRGDLASAERDSVAAESAYQEAVDAKPYQVGRLAALVQAQIALKKLDEADANLKRVLEQRPGAVGAIYLQGLSAYARGDYERAASTVAPLLTDSKVEAGPLFVAGAAAAMLHQDQQARELLPRYLTLVPTDAFAARLLGVTLLRLGEPTEALRVATPLTQVPRPAVEDLTLAGMAALMAQDTKAGIGFLERAQALNPNDRNLDRLLVAAKAGSGADGLDALERLVAVGGEGLADLEVGLLQRRLRAWDDTATLTVARRCQERYPQRPDGWIAEGIALARTGKALDARPAFEHALALDPNNADAQTGLAEVQLALGNPQAAADALAAAVAAQPTNPQLLANLIRVSVAAGKPEQAIAVLKPLQEADRDQPLLIAFLARAYTKAGQPLAALAFLSAQGERSEPAILIETAAAQVRAGRHTDALVTLRRAAAVAPATPEAQLALAQALQDAGDIKAAAPRFDQVLAQDAGNLEGRIGQAAVGLLSLTLPYQPGALKAALDRISDLGAQAPKAPRMAQLAAVALLANNQPQRALEVLAPVYAQSREAADAVLLARLRVYAKDPDGALALLREHVARYPRDPQVRWALANRYLAMNDDQAAVQELKTLVEQDWTRADAHLELAAALVRVGRKADAAPHLRVVEQSLPRDKRVQELQALMRH